MANRLDNTQIDPATFALNIKSQKSTTAAGVTNGTWKNLGENGCSITFTVPEACNALVISVVAVNSSTDFELKPGIYRNGTHWSNSDAPASLSGGAGTRAVQRIHTNLVPLVAGSNTLSAGVLVSSATGQNITAGAAEITAIVLGRVTA